MAMIRGLVALILLSTSCHTQSAEDSQQLPLIVAEPGDSVTLTCVPPEASSLVFWYRLTLGHMVQTIAKGSYTQMIIQGQFQNPRFKFVEKDDPYTLTIGNVSEADQATYLCQAGQSHVMAFVNGSVLAVKDRRSRHIYQARQWPASVTVAPGRNATLSCSILSEREYYDHGDPCPACEHRVHWFRLVGSGLAHPGAIYSHRSRGGQQGDGSCEYTLSKTIHNSSDAGTYYCAVVACGQVLFGQGTRVETGQDLLPVVIVLVLLVFCLVIVTVALIVRGKKTPDGRTGAATFSKHDGSSEGRPNHKDGETSTVTYAGLDFTSRKEKRWSNDDFLEDCSYAGIRDY